MVQMGSAPLQGAIQLPKLVGFVASMAPMGSALSTTAPQPSVQEEGVSSMAESARRKCARWKAAALLHTHVVSVASMVHMEHASLVGAPPTPEQDLNIAGNMVVERRTSRVPW